MAECFDLKRAPSENDLQYIWRICSAKDAGTINLTWEEVAEILNREIIKDESEFLGESAYRKKYQQAKAFYDSVFSHQISSDYHEQIVEQRRELQKERYKLFDERNAYNKVIRARTREEELNEIIERTVSAGNLPRLEYEPPVLCGSDASEESMLISLNDIHYGANIKNAWNTYDSTICAKRFAEYLGRIKEIQTVHNTDEAVVWCNGDTISGNIHKEIAITNKENVTEQIMGVSELIAGFLATLSHMFKSVRFVLVAGNHSRIDRKDDALKDERMDDLVRWYLCARLASFENVVILSSAQIDETMYVVNIRGLAYVGCHGDYDTSGAGVLNLQTMVQAIKHIPLYAVLSGHTHKNKIDSYQGIKQITAGSFQGVDNHCIAKRIYGKPEQLVCIVNSDGLKCSYDITLYE